MKRSTLEKAKHRAKEQSAVSKAEEPVLLQTGESVQEAGDKMRSVDASDLPVSDGDRLIGMVKGKHPDRRAAGFGHDPAAMKVGESMSHEVRYCFVDQDWQEAEQLMREHGLSH